MTNNGMTVKFRTKCEFVFEGWWTQEGDVATFMMGCVIVMFYCILHMNLLALKSILPNKLYLQTIWYFVYVLSGIMVMQFIMTMNGYVNIAVILGSVVGYTIQQQLPQKDETPPPGSCEFCN